MSGQVYIVVDTRERDVKGILQTLADAADVPCLEAQINTGDFLVCRRDPGAAAPRILAVVERKTLKDFGDSFKDGRYENRRKMIERRAAEGCALYFVVEGPAFPAASRKFSRIPYASIEAAILKMQVRDGISTLKTENVGGTADLVVKLARTYAAVAASPEGLYPWPRTGGAEPAAPTEQAPTEQAPTEQASTEHLPEHLPEPVVPDVVLGVKAKPPGIVAGEMWAKLRGISIPTGNVIAQTLSVLDVLGGADTGGLKNATGRALTRDGRASLAALLRGAREAVVKVLTGITGISPAIAAQVFDQARLLSAESEPERGFAKFFAGRDRATAIADLAAVQIQQSTRRIRLGHAKAEKIYDMLAWRRVKTESARG